MTPKNLDSAAAMKAKLNNWDDKQLPHREHTLADMSTTNESTNLMDKKSTNWKNPQR